MVQKITLQEAQEELALYKAARDKILSSGESYKMGDISLTRANLAQIEQKITDLRILVYRLSGGRTTSAPLFLSGR